MKIKNLELYMKDELNLQKKFIILMNKLINNQSNGFENLFFIIISTIQNISIYFSEKVGVFDIENNISDKILNLIEKMTRFKSLFFSNKNYYIFSIYVLFLYYFFFFSFFMYSLLITSRKQNYDNLLNLLNFLIKLNLYFLSNISLDFFTHMICFKKDYNLYIKEIKCNQSNNIGPFIISILTLFFSQIFMFFIHFFYEDNLFISVSSFSCLSSNIIIFQHLHSIISSFILGWIEEIHRGFFFLINFIMSALIFIYYLKRLIYYNQTVNFTLGLSYCLNLYASIYFFFFYFFDMSQKGLIFIISCFFIGIFFKKLLFYFTENIIKETPYYKIKNKYYILYYVKYLMDLISQSNENPDAKSLLIGIIEIHSIECPNNNCLSKTKESIYLPIENAWSDRSKSFINDKIFLKFFIVVIIGYYVKIEYFIPELIINLSHYYLEVIGNVCLSIYHYEKAKKMKLNLKEKYLLERLKMIISYKLYEHLKQENEPCSDLVDLNMTFYYKYHDIAKKFSKEIYNDLELSVEFWECFSSKKNSELIDINHVIDLIQKINDSKNTIKNLWNEMFKIYSGINSYFLLYYDYINEINDDQKLKNELENHKKKKENSTENIVDNYYNILFNKDTGIIIVNGDRGKEGIIEKANYAFANIFQINVEKIRGKNINEFMPKIFSEVHDFVMKRYFDVGNKKIIDKGNFKVFGLDKNNSIIQLQKNIKIFPMLNDYLYYVGMFNLEKNNDLILINSDFIIQGMSKKLSERLKITNDKLFISNEIPFYMICKNFINFYKTFFKNTKKKKIKTQRNSFFFSSIPVIDDYEEKEYLLKEINNDSDSVYLKESNITTKSNINNNNNKIDLEKIDDINENMEIEYQMNFPQFLSKYAYFTKNKNNEEEEELGSSINDFSQINKDFTINETTIINSENNTILNNETSIIESQNNESTILNEDNNIIMKTKTNNDLHISGNLILKKKTKNSSFYKYSGTNLNTYNNIFHEGPKLKTTPANIVIYDYSSSIPKPRKYENIRIEGLRKINLYKNLFQLGKFKELEMLFDKESFDGNIEFKFNFSFEKYFYDNEKICFIIRCIDTKIDDDDCTSKDSCPVNFSTLKLKKNKLSELKKLYTINQKENDIFKFNIRNFPTLSQINPMLKYLLQKKFRDIQSKSRVHGKNIKDSSQQFLDENASQTAGTSYNSNLSKLNRIIESRINLLQNADNFYTIKYFKIIPIFWLITVIVFSIIIVVYLNHIGNELIKIRNFSSIIFKIQIEIINILNTELDFIAIYNNHKLSKPFNITFGYDNETEFIKYSRNNISKWYNNVVSYLNFIEKNVAKYFNKRNYFWKKLNLNYFFNLPFTDSEYFPFMISSSMYNAFYLFHLNLNNVTEDEEQNILYSHYMAIHEMNFNVFPIIFSNIPHLLKAIIKFNNIQFNHIKSSILFLCGMFGIIAIWFLYIILITKKYLAVGIKKVPKINQNSISNIISNINNFKNVVKSRIKLEENDDKAIQVKFLNENKKSQNINGLYTNEEKHKSNNSEQNYFIETQKFQKFKFQSFILMFFFLNLIVLSIFMVFIYYNPKNIINDNSNLILSESYILQKFFYTSILLYKLKCKILDFPSIYSLDLSIIINESLSENLFIILKKSKIFNDFYYNGFKLDACYALFDKSSENYTSCIENPTVIDLNSTEAVKQFLIRNIDLLEYEIDSKYGNENFNLLEFMSGDDYIRVLLVFKQLYINVYERFEKTIENILVNEIKISKIKCLIVCCSLIIWVFLNLFYITFYLKKYFEKLLLVSKSFIQIIPTNIIFNTPDLEAWLEKTNEH